MTETRRLKPGSSMVTPYSTSAASIVFRLWVITMNWVCEVQLAQDPEEAVDIGVVERRVDLVEHAERARPVVEDREEQGQAGERLLARPTSA